MITIFLKYYLSSRPTGWTHILGSLKIVLVVVLRILVILVVLHLMHLGLRGLSVVMTVPILVLLVEYHVVMGMRMSVHEWRYN